MERNTSANVFKAFDGTIYYIKNGRGMASIIKTVWNPNLDGMFRTIKAGYSRFNITNLMFRSDGFIASGIFIEYDL